MIQLIDSIKYAQKYKSGVLSFAERDLPEEQKQEITAMLKRRNITKREVDSVYGIAEVGRQ